MGVVRERKAVECPASGYQTDTELENSGSNSPNEGGDNQRNQADYQFAGVSSSNARRIQNALRAYNSSLKSGQGQRKTRRALNISGVTRILRHRQKKFPGADIVAYCPVALNASGVPKAIALIRALEDLVEYEETDNLMDNYKSPFERLMETTENGPECINDFLNKLESDEEYARTVAFLNKCNKGKSIVNPYYKICHKIRRSIKVKKNFPYKILRSIESSMLDFFESTTEPFSTVPLNSFERLLFHAVAQYHGLLSITTSSNNQLSVQVTCEDDEWQPLALLLCEYLECTSDISFQIIC